MTARRMISGLLLMPLKGSVFVMNKGYETTLPASSRLVLTMPDPDMLLQPCLQMQE